MILGATHIITAFYKYIYYLVGRYAISDLKYLLICYIFAVMLAHISYAQTAINGTGSPVPLPGSNTGQVSTPKQPIQSATPVFDSMASDMLNGKIFDGVEYKRMDTATRDKLKASADITYKGMNDSLAGDDILDIEDEDIKTRGLIQPAWDNSAPQDSVISYNKCDNCSYKVLVREDMVTAVQLPPHEVITTIDIGDASNFLVSKRNDFTFTLKPKLPAIDSSILVYTKNNKIYSFYVRSEGITSPNIPHLLVKIEGVDDFEVYHKEYKETATITPFAPIPDLEVKKTAKKNDEGNKFDGSGYPENAPFNPSDLHGFNEYELWGNAPELRPKNIYRDKNFTYLDYGSDFDLSSLPAAFIVVDDIDENVNTRISGSKYIIESVSSLISLKNGAKYICIKYIGGDA